MVQTMLFVASLVGLLLGSFVLINNPKSTLFRLYFIFSLAASIWIAVNGLSIDGALVLHGSLLLYVNRLITPLSLAALLGFLFFLDYFTKRRIKRSSIILTLLVAIITAFSFTPLNVYFDSAGKLTLGSLYPFYLAVVFLSVALIVRTLYDTHKAEQETSYFKVQITYLRVGSFLALAPTIIFGAILPLFIPSPLIDLSPLFFVIFLVFAGIAIVRHRLFDLRIIAARSLAYALSLVTLGCIFTLGAFSATSLFGGDQTDPTTLRWLYASLAVILAIIFPPLKSFFNKLTNKLFFRDAYDAQAFLDEFNKNLVVTHDLDHLLQQSAKIIEKNLKPSNCVFLINGTKNTQARRSGSGTKNQLSEDRAKEIKELALHTEQKLIVTDELRSKQGSLQRLLRQGDIALMSRLTPNLTTAKYDVGYLLLGPKKSGNLYNSQDLKLIEIIANELVIAVQNALRFEEIQNFNITLQGRIDEATKKLRRANEKLRELDETKDDFISMASHQLRTPLTSVKGYISMVLEGDAGKISQKQREMLGQAFFSSQRMVYLIADLLNVSRLKTGKFVIESTPVDLAEMVREELSQLDETASSRSLTLTYDKPKNFPELMLDETKTRQVIMNFVDNAIYYTPSGGHITVHLVDGKSTVELKVEDDGIGVPKSEQPHLFTKFYRAGNARKARPDGTGLGLFMAKKVVVAQGGSLLFESQEGKGSTFGFIFSKSKLSQTKHKQ